MGAAEAMRSSGATRTAQAGDSASSCHGRPTRGIGEGRRVTGVIYRGGVPIYERSESVSPLERAAGAKILGAKAILLDF